MSTLYSRAPDVLWRNAGDRIVLRPLDGDTLLSLEGSGTLLWNLLASPIPFDDLVVAMASHYAVDVDMVADSVADVLADLEEIGLVTSTEPASVGKGGRAPARVSPSSITEEAAQ